MNKLILLLLIFASCTKEPDIKPIEVDNGCYTCYFYYSKTPKKGGEVARDTLIYYPCGKDSVSIKDYENSNYVSWSNGTHDFEWIVKCEKI